MGLDINAVAAMAAKAGSSEAKAVGALPDNVDDFVAQLVDDEVLSIGQATALRLLIGKAKVEAVAEAVRRAFEAQADVASVDAEVVSESVVEDQTPEELEAAARAFDADIERRRQEAKEMIESAGPPAAEEIDLEQIARAQQDAESRAIQDMENEGGWSGS